MKKTLNRPIGGSAKLRWRLDDWNVSKQICNKYERHKIYKKLKLEKSLYCLSILDKYILNSMFESILSCD